MSDLNIARYFLLPGFHESQGNTHEVIDPATLEPVGTRVDVTGDEIQSVLEAVTKAWVPLTAII